MNILIITQYFYPEEFKINEIAVELVNRGHLVEVITGLPNYPSGTVFSGYEKKFEEPYKGVQIHRTATRPRHTGAVNLFWNYISFMVRARKRIYQQEGCFDIIFCYMPSPVFQLSPAIYAKKKFSCPLVCMCCDQWPESLKAGGICGGPIYKIIARYCRKVFNQCDYILNVAPSFIDYNHEVNGVPKENMGWCIQHAKDNFAGVDTRKTESMKTVDLMFAGNIGKVQNVDDIVNAYDLLRYKDMKIHIFGDGSSFSDVKKLIDEKDLNKNVILYGRISNEELVGYYKKMDACLLTLSGKTAIGNTIPAKLAGYLSAGKTILAAVNGDTRKIIEEAQCGLCTEADDNKRLAELLKEFYSHKEKYVECGANGRKYYELHCTLEHFVSRLEQIFLKL